MTSGTAVAAAGLLSGPEDPEVRRESSLGIAGEDCRIHGQTRDAPRPVTAADPARSKSLQAMTQQSLPDGIVGGKRRRMS